jgi:hypothetical protein
MTCALLRKRRGCRQMSCSSSWQQQVQSLPLLSGSNSSTLMAMTVWQTATLRMLQVRQQQPQLRQAHLLVQRRHVHGRRQMLLGREVAGTAGRMMRGWEAQQAAGTAGRAMKPQQPAATAAGRLVVHCQHMLRRQRHTSSSSSSKSRR